jgi:uncharacterized protein
MTNSDPSTYPKLPRNTVNRYKPRGIPFPFSTPLTLLKPLPGKYDFTTIHSIVNTVPVLHVSFPTPDPSDPFPAMIPMLGFMGSFETPEASLEGPLDLYLHGYISSRLMRLGGSEQTGEEEGLPLTVAVSSCFISLSFTFPVREYKARPEMGQTL